MKIDGDMDVEMGTVPKIEGQTLKKRDYPEDLGTGSGSGAESEPSNETKGFWEAYEKFRREHDLVELNIDPDEIWGDVRDRSPGRDFEW